MIETNENPFGTFTPENLPPKDTVELFVDVFSDFYQIIDPGHVFIKSPRGSGKSMIFRYLQPDCQCLKKKRTIRELDFIGVYIPLKTCSFTLWPELRRLDQQYAGNVMNEHLMTLHFAIMFFKNFYLDSNFFSEVTSAAALEYFDYFLRFTNHRQKRQNKKTLKINTFDDVQKAIINILESKYYEAQTYIKKLAFTKELPLYQGDLFDYLGYFIPLVNNFLNTINLPEKTIYLLVDDAHCLTETQARVLNTWVSTRTSKHISLKISTQYNYKSYFTITGGTIDTPHDYSEIDISSIYTGKSKSTYKKRIEDIIKRRFQLKNITSSVNDFFPEDKDQIKEIKEIRKEYIEKFERGQNKGYYKMDDALRYARPDYIKSLSGTRKSSSSYSYSGFEQLVHLSSGVVRFFLEPAHHMYARETSKGKIFKNISPGVQNEISRDEAYKYLFDELEKFKHGNENNTVSETDINRLSKLIQGLGGLFRQILLTKRSERRVFSIAFSDEPSELSLRILHLGVDLGYFHKSTIGRKDSKSGGRTALYVLNRRLSPIWTLDPTSFAGYLFITNKVVEDAMINPFSMLNRIRKTKLFKEHDNLTLFDESKYSSIQIFDGDNDENITS
jgi:hypothetical protein